MSTNIATVIVNWNKKAQILDLLHDLRMVKYPLFDIFVVDNASTDGSSDSIQSNFPDVNLIINTHNLGGTGGFNIGIDYVCKLGRYDYIWLLDNDVKVTSSTLSELINVIKSDDHIGLVGSHVMDIDNRTVTVEMGGNIRWDIMGVIPVYRNTTNELKDSVIVDYVAICSALVDVKALKDVGIMDDRLFLLWDDMDWGLCFNEHGYKIIASSESIVYHGSFTERDRGPATNYYYGIRNPLLVYTKHTAFMKRCRIFYRSLRYYLKIYYFLKSHHKIFESGLICKAISDYMNNRWGKLSLTNMAKNKENQIAGETSSSYGKDQLKKILILSSGITFQECMCIIKSLNNKYPEAEITILVPDDRLEYFNNYKTHTLKRTKINNLFYAIKESIAIKRKKFDAIAFVMPSPFIYLGKSSILLNKEGEILSNTYIRPFSLIKLFLLIFYSEIIALITLPLLLYKSLQYININR